ncbi:MAG: hypothetical protein NVSMB32_10180 [Actinomycetota bacterium]
MATCNLATCNLATCNLATCHLPPGQGPPGHPATRRGSPPCTPGHHGGPSGIERDV